LELAVNPHPFESDTPVFAACEQIAAQLQRRGWCVTPDFIDAATVESLASEARQLWEQRQYRPARIGSGATLHQDRAIRGDHILWLDDAELTPAQQRYRDRLELLRQSINRQLFLGLFDLELHLAHYPVGARYRKHLDRHAHTRERLVTCILYLNENWEEDDGGQLRLYLSGDDESRYADVLPRAGVLVTFLSGEFHHEVLPARRSRLSITGWFRARRY
jgi:SM-20-related protein